MTNEIYNESFDNRQDEELPYRVKTAIDTFFVYNDKIDRQELLEFGITTKGGFKDE